MNDQDVLHETWSLPGALARVSERPEADLGAPRDALWGISGVIPDASLEHWNDPARPEPGGDAHLLAGAGPTPQLLRTDGKAELP